MSCALKAQNMPKSFGRVLLRRSHNLSLEMHLKSSMKDFLMGHLIEGFGGIHVLKSMT